jgi:hypothetical protein
MKQAVGNSLLHAFMALQPVFVDEDRVAEMQQTGFTRNFRDADGS